MMNRSSRSYRAINNMRVAFIYQVLYFLLSFICRTLFIWVPLLSAMANILLEVLLFHSIGMIGLFAAPALVRSLIVEPVDVLKTHLDCAVQPLRRAVIADDSNTAVLRACCESS